MEEKQYDIVVIGSGDAGKTVAFAGAIKDKKVAIIDKNSFEGSCSSGSCIPKKLMLAGVEIADHIRRLNNVGIRLGSGQASWKEISEYKNNFIRNFPIDDNKGFDDSGIDSYQGNARFIDDKSLIINDIVLRSKIFHIASGSKPTPLDIQGSELIKDSDDFLNLEQLPKRIIFIGGGVTSFELAHIAVRAGSEVMILHRSNTILKQYDQDLVKLLIEASKDIGVIIKTNHPLIKVEKYGTSYVVFTQKDGREIRENADIIIHGAGRVPDINDLNLEKGNIAFSNKGVTVNKYLQSISNPFVYAAGDAANTGPMLTPVGMLEGKIAAYNIFHRSKKRYPDYSYIPSCVFSIPTLAKAGCSEQLAKKKGLHYSSYFKNIAGWFHNSRTNEKFAAYKILIQKNTNRIIGAHVLGEKADEMINLLSFAMQHKMSVKDLKKPIYAYPTALSSVQYMFD